MRLVHRVIRRFPPLRGGIFVFIFGMLLVACDRGPDEVLQFTGPTMGTIYTVKALPVPEGITVAELQSGVDGVLARVNGQMSTYDPDSELSRFNQAASVEWVPVSRDLAAVVDKALRISELSEGAFDVTVGPLVNLWGFGPQGTDDNVPSLEAIREALSQVGYRHLHARDQPPALKKDRVDLYVDLSALAKGYAVDRVADYLESQGIARYLVEVGGELRAKGHNPSDIPWTIAVEQPTPERRAIERIIRITEGGLATSGDYRNFFIQNGQRYSHVIDPNTGWPVRHTLASVTVVDTDCLQADALATALLVLGPERGLELARNQKLAAFFIVITDSGFEEQYTAEFAPYLAD